MKNLIIGYGQIGQAVGAVIGEHHWADEGESPPNDQYDILHICFPYDEDFDRSVHAYIDRFTPEHVIVYSTVPIGTCYSISLGMVHSPVEGVHPELESSIRQMERWLGYNDRGEALFFANYFRDLGMRVKLVENTDFTEALKLLSTAEYGANLVFADYKAKVANEIGMNYELTKEWNQEYNRLYRNLGMDKRFQKYVLDAPGGKIGGHCVVPNAKLLAEKFPAVMLDEIKRME